MRGKRGSTGLGRPPSTLLDILTVQMNFVARDALITTMHAWVLKRSAPLGRILDEQ